MDLASREVRRGDRPIELTRTEFTLLELFLRRPRRVLERSFILEEVWGFDFPTTANSLEVYVGYLRRKTEAEDETAAAPHRARRGIRAARSRERPGDRRRLRLVDLGRPRWHYRRSLASRVTLLTTMAVGLAVARGRARGVRHRADAAGELTRQLAASTAPTRPATASLLAQLTGADIPEWALGAADVKIILRGQHWPHGGPWTRASRAICRCGEPEIAVASSASSQSVRTVRMGTNDYRVVAVPAAQSHQSPRPRPVAGAARSRCSTGSAW